eukprot:TRINITY_DN7723_c0_g2_i1.p1 TRINITY_DN7723_c0_g2~~TRINITY_DN7723_c0_g2_i1.p1  ORF type:complete len:1267 (+),score=364.40 TRINITY_DN7723_c0_g2_i1:99-3899(+)
MARRFPLPAKALMLGTTLMSTMVSFVGGLIMYLEGLQVVEDNVKEISQIEVLSTARRLNASLHASFEASEVYRDKLTLWNGLKTWEDARHFLEIDQFSHVRASDSLYGIGVIAVPLVNTTRNSSAMIQMIWWDPLDNTEGVPKGTKEYVSAHYLPPDWGRVECAGENPTDTLKHRCVVTDRIDSNNGTVLGLAYHYSDNNIIGLDPEGRWAKQQEGWEEHDTVWWRAADVWHSRDRTPYGFGSLMRTVKKQPPDHPLWGAGYKLTILTFNIFNPWEDVLRAIDANALLVAAFLNDGVDSQAIASNTGERLMAPDCAVRLAASGRNPCFVTLSQLRPDLLEACIKSNQTEEGYFFRTSIGGSDHWVIRRVVHQTRPPHDEMASIHLVWLRKVSTVEDKLNRALYFFVGFVAAVFIFDICICIIEVKEIARPLKQLKQSMDPLDRMDLDEAEARLEKGQQERGGCIVVSEVEALVVRFKQTFDALREYRRFLPEGVLVEPEREPEPEDHTSPLKSDGTSDTDTLSSSAQRTSTCSLRSKPRERAGLDRSMVAAMFDVGDFRTKQVSLMVASVTLDAAVDLNARPQQTADCLTAMRDYVSGVLDVVQVFGGMNVSTTTWDNNLNLLYSWNALKPFPMHAPRACETALAVGQFINKQQLVSKIGVSGGRVKLGNVGNIRQRSQLIVGPAVQQCTWLLDLARANGATMLCTQMVYEQVRSTMSARVIDAVDKSAGDMLIYELMDVAYGALEEQQNFVRGFAALRAGDCIEAQKQFRAHMSLCGADQQALRLFRIAFALDMKDGQDRQLLRAPQPRWSDLESDAEAFPLPEDVVAVETASAAVLPVAPSDRDTEMSPMPEQTEAEMLKEQIREAYSNMDSDHGSRSGRDNPPTTFKDARGREYRRSDKSLGKGAFGHVWLGLAADGFMVAVKSIKLKIEQPQMSGGGSYSAPCVLGGGEDASGGGNAGGWTVGGDSDEADEGGGWTVGGNESAADETGGWTVGPTNYSAGNQSGSKGAQSAGNGTQPTSQAGSSFTTFAAPGQTMARRQVTEMLQEVMLMVSLRHDNVVQFLGCAVRNAHVLIVMEYLPGGSLSGALSQFGGNLPLSCVKRYTRDIVTGLRFIHHAKPPIVHRDLKPANVLLTIDGQCKLADFGASAELKQAAAKSEEEDMPVGTPLYMPPEQSRGQATTFSDIWSLGIMVCELCTGKCPWGAIGNILRFIKNLGDPEMNMLPTIPEELTEEARSLAEICIKRDPAQRPSARKLLNHPFLLS